jgi:hypothetical protein
MGADADRGCVAVEKKGCLGERFGTEIRGAGEYVNLVPIRESSAYVSIDEGKNGRRLRLICLAYFMHFHVNRFTRRTCNVTWVVP